MRTCTQLYVNIYQFQNLFLNIFSLCFPWTTLHLKTRVCCEDMTRRQWPISKRRLIWIWWLLKAVAALFQHRVLFINTSAHHRAVPGHVFQMNAASLHNPLCDGLSVVARFKSLQLKSIMQHSHKYYSRSSDSTCDATNIETKLKVINRSYLTACECKWS